MHAETGCVNSALNFINFVRFPQGFSAYKSKIEFIEAFITRNSYELSKIEWPLEQKSIIIEGD